MLAKERSCTAAAGARTKLRRRPRRLWKVDYVAVAEGLASRSPTKSGGPLSMAGGLRLQLVRRQPL